MAFFHLQLGASRVDYQTLSQPTLPPSASTRGIPFLASQFGYPLHYTTTLSDPKLAEA